MVPDDGLPNPEMLLPLLKRTWVGLQLNLKEVCKSAIGSVLMGFPDFDRGTVVIGESVVLGSTR